MKLQSIFNSLDQWVMVLIPTCLGLRRSCYWPVGYGDHIPCGCDSCEDIDRLE